MSTRRAFLGLAILSWSLVTLGCGGGSSGGDPILFLDPAGVQAHAVCDKLFACCQTSELATLFGGMAPAAEQCAPLVQPSTSQALVAAVADGRVIYDGAAMRACVEAYAAAGCDEHETFIRCPAAFTGTLAVGASCDAVDGIGCVSGTFCDSNATSPICVAFVGPGDPCTAANAACGDGLTCGANGCEAQHDVGDACTTEIDCEQALTCDTATSKCVVPPPVCDGQ